MGTYNIEIGKFMHEGAKRGRQENTYAHRTGHAVEVIESLEIGSHDDGRVDVSFQEALDGGEHFTGQDDNRSGSIADFLILSSGQFDHGFGCGMSNINLHKRETMI